MRQPLRLPLGLSSLPPTGAASLADDFAERHAPVDLRDLDLDLVPDLRPRDEDHEVRDPRESVAFPTDIFDLGLVHLPFLHRTFEGRKPDPEYDIHDSMRRPPATATFRICCTVYNDIAQGAADALRAPREDG